MTPQSTSAPPDATAGPPAQELLLSDGRRTPPGARAVRLRRIVALTVVSAVGVAALVAFTSSLVSRRIAEQQAVHDVAQLTDVLAENVVQPALTDAMQRNPAVAT